MNTQTRRDWNDRMADSGRWDQVRGKIREEWAEVTDQHLEEARGNFEQLVGKIKETTGETADKIERKLQEITS